MKPISISPCVFSSIELFHGLGDTVKKEVARSSVGQLFDEGETILSRDSSSEDVIFLLSGLVRISNFSVSGKEVTFREQGAGEVVGLLSAIDGKPRSADVTALEKTLIARTPRVTFQKCYRDYPEIAERIMAHLTELVRMLSDRVNEYGTMTVKQRLYSELLRLGDSRECLDDEAIIANFPTHIEIANRIATHREAVSRELSNLLNQNLIRKNGKDIIIESVSELRSRLDIGDA